MEEGELVESSLSSDETDRKSKRNPKKRTKPLHSEETSKKRRKTSVRTSRSSRQTSRDRREHKHRRLVAPNMHRPRTSRNHRMGSQNRNHDYPTSIFRRSHDYPRRSRPLRPRNVHSRNLRTRNPHKTVSKLDSKESVARDFVSSSSSSARSMSQSSDSQAESELQIPDPSPDAVQVPVQSRRTNFQGRTNDVYINYRPILHFLLRGFNSTNNKWRKLDEVLTTSVSRQCVEFADLVLPDKQKARLQQIIQFHDRVFQSQILPSGVFLFRKCHESVPSTQNENTETATTTPNVYPNNNESVNVYPDNAEPIQQTNSYPQPKQSSSKSVSPPVENEADITRIVSREKQVEMGKQTPEYKNYIKTVPKFKRSHAQPQTPNPRTKMANKVWKARVSKWRKRLHEWDVSSDQSDQENVEDTLFRCVVCQEGFSTYQALQTHQNTCKISPTEHQDVESDDDISLNLEVDFGGSDSDELM